jgi:hypothetical protein
LPSTPLWPSISWAARLLERQSLRNQRLDLALCEHVQQREQVMTNHAGLNRINHWML